MRRGARGERWDRIWYGNHILSLVLLPLASLFCLGVFARRQAYRRGWLRVYRLPVPVIVVGNITVGGSGKTPLVAWIARYLTQAGYRPGIVSRGYGGEARLWPQTVTGDSDPRLVGDEPVLLAARGGCPVVAAPWRIEAARLLLGRYGCDVIVSDDGLQHYALGRDIEIAVINGIRRYGNGFCLPAGPLREPKGRLAQVNLRVCHGGTPGPGEFAMRVRPGELRNLGREGQSRALLSFAGEKVHAVAGIAHPQRFFSLLSGAGLDIIPHAFPDHYPFRLADIEFPDKFPVLMTEKDAVKCRRFANLRYWYLPLEVYPDPTLGEALLTLLRRRVYGQEAA